MRIPGKERPKIAFICHVRTFRYMLMPFELASAPACLQLALDGMLIKYKWKQCFVYLDDVIIFPQNLDDLTRHVDEILSTLGDAGFTLKFSKFHFSNERWSTLATCPSPEGSRSTGRALNPFDKLSFPPTRRSSDLSSS